MRTIQKLLGHASIQTTVRHTYVGRRHIGTIRSPLDHGGRTRCRTPNGASLARAQFRLGDDGETVMRLSARRLRIPNALVGPLRVDVLHGGVRHRVGTAASCAGGERSLRCG